MIPFLSVKPSAIRVKVRPQFPASLLGGTAIVISKTNGIYTINLNYEELQIAALGTGANDYIAIWDSASGQFFRIKISDFVVLIGGVPEAPNDGIYYGRRNTGWAAVPPEAPNDGNYYARRNLGWSVSPPFPEPANDGKLYGRAQTAGVGAWARSVPNAGNISADAMSGPLWLSGDPAAGENLRATTKQYVDGKFPVEASITPIFASNAGSSGIGNGVISGKILRLSPTCVLAAIDVTFGTTSTFGTGYLFVALPAPYNGSFSLATSGIAWMQNAGTNFMGGTFLGLAGTNQLILFGPSGSTSGGPISNSLVPFTWGNGSRLALSAICWGI